ncbi:ADP-ribose pyrophosphatase of COG1058 family [Candidatus Syntrophocurvum alkaliphilum]|uniref:Putative competence-damage inducible protein n=1 Tax=Candidatus Syntrophocurvum alkaliphilum TaxID=2293317 RepID=A0A6I6DJT4_9FIRM|nr:competence/damage-inducible protein A [Candidatus Syntrophocurvum alkaliphilum]QGT99641.1 ADP-ribose pyrophosphatase of COG1058 family [Candidatus Syntrophocurvum alkaliphilum]
MKTAYLISTGTELLLGLTLDTNSIFISERLEKLGVKVIGKSIVGDNKENLIKAFKLGLESADVVITTGGLGPTKDDLTKEIACEVLGIQSVLNKKVEDNLQNFFAKRNRDMPKSNIKQAMFPKDAIILKNSIGTAPGMYIDKGNKKTILLPGPPNEMRKMYEDEVEPLLIRELNLEEKKIATKVIKVIGPGESQIEEMIAEVMNNPNGCSIVLLAHEGEVHIRVTADRKDFKESQENLDIVVNNIIEKTSNYIYGYDEETLPSNIVKLLDKKGKTIAFAESCTGGLISKLITDVPGSSSVFWGTIVSYSNKSKIGLLDVKENTINKNGAVSEETAYEMAKGALKVSDADIGVAVTGIAGPDGGTEQKPVGEVYIAIAFNNYCTVKKLRFVGDRDAIRMLTAKSALDLIRKKIK